MQQNGLRWVIECSLREREKNKNVTTGVGWLCLCVWPVATGQYGHCRATLVSKVKYFAGRCVLKISLSSSITMNTFKSGTVTGHFFYPFFKCVSHVFWDEWHAAGRPGAGDPQDSSVWIPDVAIPSPGKRPSGPKYVHLPLVPISTQTDAVVLCLFLIFCAMWSSQSTPILKKSGPRGHRTKSPGQPNST